MKAARRAILMWMALFWGLSLLYAQNTESAHYSSRNGLPTDIVKHTVSDAQGFLWMATDEGLVRHNGHTAADFSSALPSHYVKQIYPSASGLLYVVTDMGIVSVETHVDTAIVRPFLMGSGQLSNSTLQWPKSIYEDAQGLLWIGESNVVRADHQKIQKRYLFQPPYNQASFTRGFSFAEDGWGTLWALSNAGYIFWLDTQADSFRLAKLPIEIGSIDAVWRRGEGVLWVGGSKGVFQISLLEDHTVRDCHLISDLSNVSSIWVRANGHTFVGTYNHGVYEGWMRHGALQLKRIEQVGTDVQALSGDEWENVWASTMKGAYQIRQTYMGTFSTALGYSNSVAQAPSGEVFFTNGSGLSKAFWAAGGHLEEQGGLKHVLTAKMPSLAPQRIMSLAATQSDLWFGVDYGWIYRYHFASETITKIEGSKVGESVFFLTADSEGKVWSCHDQYNGVLCTDSTGKALGYTTPSRIIVAKESPNGSMYFGGLSIDGYLYRFNRKTGTFENLSKPLENATGIVVNDMAFGKNDTIWIGTGDGVMIYTPSGIAKADWYKSAWGPVHAIAAFPDGRIWVGCKPGLVEYKHGALNILDQSSGLASNFINYRSIAVSKEGQAFVATSEGTSFIASSYVASSLTPKPFITAVESGGRNMKPSAVEALPSGSYLLLQFVVPAYPAQHQEYQYRLSADEAWSPSFVKPEIALHQLKAGKYELQIRARQKGGYQWSKPAVFAFTVKLPWHKQWWAYLLFTLGGLGIIWAAVRINTIRLKKEKERLEKIIGDRTKEIWQKNQALETQKEEIQIQNAALQSQKEEIQAQNEELIQLTEEIASQRDKIEVQNRLLSEQHARTTDSIRYAQQIQQSILPTPEHMSSVFSDYFTLYKPKDIVSGDFYWMAQRDEAIYLAVADCTGHGVPGAFMSMIGSRILNEVVMEQQHEAPADILEVIDAHMREALQQKAHREGGVTDGMDVALCRICRLADGTTEVRFAGAKNHLFYLSSGTLHRIKGSKRSIGGNLATAHHFEESRIVLQANDILYLATDGFADQSNEQRQKLGTPQLIQLIEAHSNAPMHTQKQRLEHVLQEFKGSAEQRDDITVLGIRI